MIHGIAYTKAQFLKVKVAVETAAPAAQQAVGEEVADGARSKVAVLTGETRASIESSTQGCTAAGAGIFLEFGTAHMAAQPFMRPAADEATGIGAEMILRSAISGVL